MIDSTQARRETEVLLHTDSSGSIWAGERDSGRVDVVGANPQIDDVLKTIPAATQIHILGLAANAELIAKVYKQLVIPGNANLRIAGPSGLTSQQIHRPDMVIAHMQRINQPGSLGGWHTARLSDYINYSLMHAQQAADEGECTKWFNAHPARPAFSYLETDMKTAVPLICSVVDPRWFVDPMHPDRTNRLNSYFGLSEVNFAKLANKAETKSKLLEKTRLVWDCWAKPKSNFVHDTYADYAQVGIPVVKALTAAAQGALEFVTQVWLQSVVPPNVEVFVPEYFFRSPEIADNYKAFRTQFPVNYNVSAEVNE